MLATHLPKDAFILKWGNSHAVRLTTDMLKAANMLPSDQVRIYSESGRIIIESVSSKPNLMQLLASIPEGQGLTLVAYGAPIGREV